MLIAGPQVMLGYFSNPQQTAKVLHTDEHGVTWLHTGDIVRIDEEGFFYVLDRKKDMIIRGGLKISRRRWKRSSAATHVRHRRRGGRPR